MMRILEAYADEVRTIITSEGKRTFQIGDYISITTIDGISINGIIKKIGLDSLAIEFNHSDRTYNYEKLAYLH